MLLPSGMSARLLQQDICQVSSSLFAHAELIEAMRRKVGVNPSTSAQDISSIETIELLGEGAFGKVSSHLHQLTVHWLGEDICTQIQVWLAHT